MDEELEKLFEQGDKACENLKNISKEIKEKGIIGFCKDCGVSIYKDKEHNCS